MRLIIAGGGTGGHLYPGIALAEELRRRDPDTTTLFVGTARGLEARVVPQEGYALELIEQSGIKGGGLGGSLRGLLQVPRAMLQSVRIIRRFRPDVVVGVGGYSSGPLVLTAALLGRPTAILEQNTIPGITNRILGRFVHLALVSFEVSRAHFPARKVRVIGNPIRLSLATAQPSSTKGGAARPPPRRRSRRGPHPPRRAPLARDSLRSPDEREHEALHVLILGGSQGARALNRSIPEAMAQLARVLEPRLLRVTHQCGASDEGDVLAAYEKLGFPAEVVAFIDDMASAYARADLAVCRAGATTLAELTALGVPSVLIPFPFAADDHQTVNARSVVEAGGAVLLPESELTPPRLAEVAGAVAREPERLAAMAEAAGRLGKPDAAARAADACLELANGV